MLVSEPELAALTVVAQTKESVTLGLAESSGKAVLTYSPFRLDFYRGDDLLLSTNARGLLKYEHQRHKKGSAEAVETGEWRRISIRWSVMSFFFQERRSWKTMRLRRLTCGRRAMEATRTQNPKAQQLLL